MVGDPFYSVQWIHNTITTISSSLLAMQPVQPTQVTIPISLILPTIIANSPYPYFCYSSNSGYIKEPMSCDHFHDIGS